MERFELTKKENELMNFLWDSEKPLTSNEMLAQCPNREWSESYLHVMLRSLMRKGAIAACGMVQYGTQYARQFQCKITKEEYYVMLAMKNGVGSRSLARAAVAFAAPLCQGEEERQETIATLEQMLEELKSEEE